MEEGGVAASVWCVHVLACESPSLSCEHVRTCVRVCESPSLPNVCVCVCVCVLKRRVMDV